MGGLRRRLRSPAGIATLLALAGIAGATSVYVAARTTRSRDRADLLRWEAAAEVPVAMAEAALEAIDLAAHEIRAAGPRSRTPRSLSDARADLERSRRDLLDLPIPGILERTAALYLEAIARALEAVTALQDVVNYPDADPAPALARYDSASALSAARFRQGDAAHARLRARVKLAPTPSP